MKHLLILAVLLLGAAVVNAQQPFSADRPGRTVSPDVLPEGYVQAEAGFTWSSADFRLDDPFTFQSAASVYRHTRLDLPEGVLRVGMGERFELRLASGYRRLRWKYDPDYFYSDGVDSPIIENRNAGINALTVGIKSALTAQRGWIPQAALIAAVTVPRTGSPIYQVIYAAPDFTLAFAHALSAGASVSYNAGMRWDGSTATPIGYYSASLSLQLFEDVRGFLELYGDLPGFAPPLHTLDGGLSWQLRDDLQIDLSGGLGLVSPEEDSYDAAWTSVQMTDYYASLGASWRLRLW